MTDRNRLNVRAFRMSAFAAFGGLLIFSPASADGPRPKRTDLGAVTCQLRSPAATRELLRSTIGTADSQTTTLTVISSGVVQELDLSLTRKITILSEQPDKDGFVEAQIDKGAGIESMKIQTRTNGSNLFINGFTKHLESISIELSRCKQIELAGITVAAIQDPKEAETGRIKSAKGKPNRKADKKADKKEEP